MTAMETCKVVNDVVTAALLFVSKKRELDAQPNAYNQIPAPELGALYVAVDALRDHALAEAIGTWNGMNAKEMK